MNKGGRRPAAWLFGGVDLDLQRLVSDLVSVHGVAGHEAPVAARVQELWQPLCDQVGPDAAGNCVGLKRGDGPEPRPRVMLAAHMDSIGFLVSRIEKGGFLRLTPVGGWDRRILLGQEVIVHGRRPLTGVVGSKPPHVTPAADRRKVPAWKELFVDTGLAEDEVRALAPVGTPVTLRNELTPLLGDRVAGGALDDRAGIAAVSVALEELSRLRHSADVYAVATVSEEFADFTGAFTSTYAIEPDLGVAIDVTHAEITGPGRGTVPLLGGPAVLIGPGAHPKLSRLLAATARAEGIAHQVEVEPGASGTDGWAMQVVRSGVPVAVLSIPLRYMHTPVEVISLEAVRSTGRLLARMCARVDRALVEDLACY